MDIYTFFSQNQWMFTVLSIIVSTVVILVTVLSLKGTEIELGPFKLKKKKDTLDTIFAYADFIWDLKEEEHSQIEDIKSQARVYTRLHVDDTLAQMRMMNHALFMINIDKSLSPVQDYNFNSISKGSVRNIMTKELMDVFERNHLVEMTEDEYRRVMEGNYSRIKRLVVDAFAIEWHHPHYSFQQFSKALEENQERGFRDFMMLIGHYRSLAEKKKNIKNLSRRQAKLAREYIKLYGKLPEDIVLLSDKFVNSMEKMEKTKDES